MDKSNSWWYRPCGGFDVLRQAIPLVISAGAISLLTFTDRMFLSWLPGDCLNPMTASMMGGMLYWAVIALPWAVAGFVTTFVAQYHGSGNYQHIGRIVWQGIWFGLATMPILLLFFEPLAKVFVLFGHDEELVRLERIYLFYLLLGSGAAISGEAAASYFRGQGKMRVEMYNNVFCVVLNIFLNYCFIFGNFGAPRWELAGAAITTAFCLWLRLAIYMVLMFLHDQNANKFHVLGGMRPSLSLLKRLGYYGVPAGFYTAVDCITFGAFLMMIGFFGSVERDATTIAFTLNNFTYIALAGIGIVVTSMVGNQLGANRPDLARRAAITALILGCVYVGGFGIGFLVVPDLFLFPFAQSDGYTAEVRALSIILLWFVAAYLLFDSCAIIFMSTLRGAGDTIFIAWAVTIMTPFLPIICGIGIYFFDLGIIWCWAVLTVYILVYCGVFFLRYRSKIWESKRVIEKELR